MCIGAAFYFLMKIATYSAAAKEVHKKIGRKEKKMKASAANWFNSISTPYFWFCNTKVAFYKSEKLIENVFKK